MDAIYRVLSMVQFTDTYLLPTHYAALVIASTFCGESPVFCPAEFPIRACRYSTEKLRCISASFFW